MKSVAMTAEQEFIPDDKLDMAAERMAAITRPVNPAGITVMTKCGSSLSVFCVRVTIWIAVPDPITVKVVVQVALLPAPSVAVTVIVCVPTPTIVPAAGD